MYEDLVETKLACEKIFDGTLLHVRRDTVRLPNGKDAVREWIMHPGAAAVLPILPNGDVILVRQYRYPIGAVTLEVPAGKLGSAALRAPGALGRDRIHGKDLREIDDDCDHGRILQRVYSSLCRTGALLRHAAHGCGRICQRRPDAVFACARNDKKGGDYRLQDHHLLDDGGRAIRD